jgi:hypothetical protein
MKRVLTRNLDHCLVPLCAVGSNFRLLWPTEIVPHIFCVFRSWQDTRCTLVQFLAAMKLAKRYGDTRPSRPRLPRHEWTPRRDKGGYEARRSDGRLG